MTFTYNFITSLITSENRDWLIKLFKRAIPKDSYDDWCDGDIESVVKRSVIYEWWEDYLTKNIKCKALRDALNDSLYDEDIYALLTDIDEKFGVYKT